MRKHFLTAVILSIICINNFNIITLASNPYQHSVNSHIEERADAYEWRYKVINGKLYRRLFNLTKAEWAGNWELVS